MDARAAVGVELTVCMAEHERWRNLNTKANEGRSAGAGVNRNS